MSNLEAKKIAPATGTTVTLGAAGDAVTVSANALKTNTIKDAGGNTLFTSNGSGTLSSVNSDLKGGLILISSQTATGAASVEFTSNIDSTYNEYVFMFTNCNPATNDRDFQISFSDDAGSSYGVTKTTTFFRAAHSENNTTIAALNYETGFDLAQSTAVQKISHGVGGGADESTAGIVNLFSPASTAYVKNFYARTVTVQTNWAVDAYIAGYCNTTSAINGVKFNFASSSNFDGIIAMYGTG